MSSKYWCFTWNNPLTKTLALPTGATYLVWQLEKGESGTLHLQGYVEWKSQATSVRCHKWLPHAAFFVRRGTAQQAADYCRKTEGRQEGPWELGAMSVSEQGARTDLVAFTAAIRDGASNSELLDAYPSLVYKHSKMIAFVRMSYPPKEKARQVILCLGPSGKGKTTFARSLGEQQVDLCVLPVTKDMWFDGCEGKRVCVLDDFAGNIKLAFLLRLLHPFPESVAIKGGFAVWNPEVVVITTNFPPEAWYDWTKRGEHALALNRRFTRLLWFGDASSFASAPVLPGSSVQWELYSPSPVVPAPMVVDSPVLPRAGHSLAEVALMAAAESDRQKKKRPWKMDANGKAVRTVAPIPPKKRAFVDLSQDSDDELFIED